MSKMRCRYCGYPMGVSDSRCSSCGCTNSELENTEDKGTKQKKNSTKTVLGVIITLLI